MDKTTVSAILLAAGSSSRMGENKMLMRFCGKTPVELCVEAFCGIADEAVIAVSPDTEEIVLAAAKFAPYPVKIVRGKYAAGVSIQCRPRSIGCDCRRSRLCPLPC